MSRPATKERRRVQSIIPMTKHQREAVETLQQEGYAVEIQTALNLGAIGIDVVGANSRKSWAITDRGIMRRLELGDVIDPRD
jgi:hypothetical protein